MMPHVEGSGVYAVIAPQMGKQVRCGRGKLPEEGGWQSSVYRRGASCLRGRLLNHHLDLKVYDSDQGCSTPFLYPGTCP